MSSETDLSVFLLDTNFLLVTIAGCNKDEFDCEDATCINIKLKCNHNVNCRFQWDEDDCDVSDTPDPFMNNNHKLQGNSFMFNVDTGGSAETNNFAYIAERGKQEAA